MSCDQAAAWVFDGRGNKPLEIPFLDGAITVLAIAAGDTGQPHIRFAMKKPAEATMVLQNARLLHLNDIQYGSRYQPPAKTR